MSRILGVDLGTVRVGLAISDPEGILAQPMEVIPRENADVEIAYRATRFEVTEIVVGIPFTMDWSKGKAAKEAEAFADALEERTKLVVARWDERLTTKEAERAMRDVGKDARRQRGMVDKIAAALILQSYLDSRRMPRAT
jgi:putative Holliday junction resolvase